MLECICVPMLVCHIDTQAHARHRYKELVYSPTNGRLYIQNTCRHLPEEGLQTQPVTGTLFIFSHSHQAHHFKLKIFFDSEFYSATQRICLSSHKLLMIHYSLKIISCVRLECLCLLENGLHSASNAHVPQVLRMEDTTICRRQPASKNSTLSPSSNHFRGKQDNLSYIHSIAMCGEPMTLVNVQYLWGVFEAALRSSAKA